MCGIAGIFDREDTGRIRKDTIIRMMQALQHRGPDDDGSFLDRKVGLGFRRLSIVDLAGGQQPMFNEDHTLVLICNGEIFNHKHLRKQLEAAGHSFRTNCDVEVLLHLYEEYGTGFLNTLNGQFAFCLYDIPRQQMLLVRDQVGIVPLFYTMADGFLLFGSEIKALLEHPAVKRKVSLTGLDQVMTFPGTVSPVTMFENILSLKPGHFMRIDTGHVEISKYWDLQYPREQDEAARRPDTFYLEELRYLLRQSVDCRMQADTAVGFYLSGGLDSSLICAMAHELYPEIKKDSFSISFNEKDINESRFQRIVSNKIESVHHELVFTTDDIHLRLKDAVFAAEAPLRETYNTCSLKLSEFVHANDIKVILSGEGADELFCGYMGYKFDHKRRELTSELVGYEKAMEEEMRMKMWGDGTFQYEHNLFPFLEVKRAIYSQGLVEQLPDFESIREGILDHQQLDGRNLLHKRSYIDFKMRLADHLLADHGDRVCYANGVEARYPFLDINLIEFMREVPSHLKVNGMQEKYILRKCAESYLPKEITGREKFGFVAPASPFLLKENIEWINDILAYDTIKKQGYFNPDTVERLRKQYTQDDFFIKPTFENDLLITVITFGIFLELFGMPNHS